MSSLKSLMAAKRQQAKITAPHARYSGPRNDQLSCSLCHLAIKHESLWSAHVQSKVPLRCHYTRPSLAWYPRVAHSSSPSSRQTHRVNVQRHDADQHQHQSNKRKRTQDSPSAAKRARADADDSEDDAAADAQASGGALPADFFADPAQAPEPRAPSPEPPSASASTSAAAPAQDEGDPDLDDFLASLGAPDASTTGPTPGPSTARATIAAAPVRFEFGAPVVAAEGEDGEDAAAEGEDDGEPAETEDERAEREAREEREEMMARLEEEEREQREADEKVTVRRRAALSLSSFASSRVVTRSVDKADDLTDHSRAGAQAAAGGDAGRTTGQERRGGDGRVTWGFRDSGRQTGRELH